MICRCLARTRRPRSEELGEPARVEPLRYRWLLLCATRPTREARGLRQVVRASAIFLLASLLLHLRGAGC